MNKIRIIDLLNKIANGEDVPKKIKINSWLWEYKPLAETYYTDKSEENLFEYYRLDKSTLNRELEIIEDTKEDNKKIERINDKETNDMKVNRIELSNYGLQHKIVDIYDKINEIIDKLNEGDK